MNVNHKDTAAIFLYKRAATSALLFFGQASQPADKPNKRD